MNQSPRCSVVIPTYNCLDFLPLAIASVRVQAIEDLEILVVDDGSTDGTGEWLAKEAFLDRRIIPLQADGGGPGFSRNLAISHARAPLVAFLDADDLWWPLKLARQLEYHELNQDVGLSFTDYLHVDPRGEVRGTCFDYWRPAYVDRADFGFKTISDPEFELLAANVVGTSTVVASRKALQNANGFASGSQSAEDWELWLRLAAIAPVACSAATTMTYLMRPSSETQNRSARIDAMKIIVDRYKHRSEPSARKAWRQATARIKTAEAERARAVGDWWGAACAHARAFARWPQRRIVRAVASDLVAAFRQPARAA